MIKAAFPASLLQSSVSRDSSEIIIICRFSAQETFLIISNVENSCSSFCFQDSLMNIKFERIAFIEIQLCISEKKMFYE